MFMGECVHFYLFAIMVWCGSSAWLKWSCCVNFFFVIIIVVTIVVKLVVKPWILIIKAAFSHDVYDYMKYLYIACLGKLYKQTFNFHTVKRLFKL